MGIPEINEIAGGNKEKAACAALFRSRFARLDCGPKMPLVFGYRTNRALNVP